MAENEVATKVEDCENIRNIRINASHNDRYSTIFMTNYNQKSAEDLTMTMYFKDARAGVARLKVYRIDDDKKWNSDTFELIPTENRTVYVHEDFHFNLYIPADSVVMIVLDYDV
jgi:alpha-galactosidase